MIVSHPIKSFVQIFGGLFLILFLSACNGQSTDVYIPATRIPTQPPTVTNQASALPPTHPPPTPTTACANSLTFLTDLTIPDGSEVRQGSKYDKRWQVKNSGDCNWDASYRLKRVTGSAMGAAEELAIYPARGGSEATIRVIFTAPEEAGDYSSAWQAYAPDGQAFGDPVYIAVVVVP